MRKSFITSFGLVLALAAGVGLLLLRPEAPQSVKTVTVERGNIESLIRVTGRVINDRTVTLTALLDGQVQSMLVQKGQVVQAGQVLAELDPREANALFSKAQAVVAQEQDRVEQLTRKLTRLNQVSRMGGESVQAVDDAEAALSAARAQLRVAEAELRVAQIHQEKIAISAPFDGVITEKVTEVGQWVEAGTKLLTLVANAGREIEANVDAADSGLVASGQAVSISCDAYPGRSWSEQIQWIAPALMENNKEAINTFAVRMSLGDSAPPLLLGQQVDVTIITAQRENVLKLPYGALIDNEDANRQVAIMEAGQVRFLPVEIGIEDLSHVEITAGLEPGMQVILPEGKTLTAGMAVQSTAGGTP